MKFSAIILLIFFSTSAFAQQNKNHAQFSSDDIIGVIHQNGKTFLLTEDTVFVKDGNFILEELADSVNYIYDFDNSSEKIDFRIFPYVWLYENSYKNIQFRNYIRKHRNSFK